MLDLTRPLESLTTDWLTETLRASNALAKARVTAFEATQIGTFSSELWRIHLQYDELEPSAPLSLVAKHPRTDPRTHSGAGFAEHGMGEFRGQGRGAFAHHGRAPRCHG